MAICVKPKAAKWQTLIARESIDHAAVRCDRKCATTVDADQDHGEHDASAPFANAVNEDLRYRQASRCIEGAVEILYGKEIAQQHEKSKDR